MATYHRSQRLKLIGSPSVEQLQNGRYRLTFNMKSSNPKEDWYNANKARIFADYGTLQSAQMSVAGIPARTGEAYSDMVLVSAASTQQGDDYVIVFIYETLSSTFVQVKDDTIDLELNNLRRVTREKVAYVGTDVPADEKDIGSDFIDHQIDSETAVRCFLASYEIDDNDSFRKLTQIYIQPGEVSRNIRNVGDGVQQTTHRFFHTEGTVVGDIISRDTSDFLGFKTIVVSALTKKDGSTLTNADGSAKLCYQYQQLEKFVFPGVVDLELIQGHAFPNVRSPVQSNVKATVYNYYQSNTSNIVDADFTTQSALGLWNPSDWAQKISHIDAFVDANGNVEPAYYNTQGIRGCRTRNSFTISGDLTDLISSDLKYTPWTGEVEISSITLEETADVHNTKSVYRKTINYVRDITRRLNVTSGGAFITQNTSSQAAGEFIIELKWNNTNWVLSGTNTIVDPMTTVAANSGSGTYVYTFSQAAGAYVDGYTNKSSTATYTNLFTSTNGNADPTQASWPTGVTVSELSTEEEIGNVSIGSAALARGGAGANVTIPAFGGWIEGRRSPIGANGTIRVSGGPPDPLGKVYTLDVQMKKAFTTVSGTDIYLKQIVVATCTPA